MTNEYLNISKAIMKDPEKILHAIEKVDGAINITSDVEIVLDNVIHEILHLFQSDRAWLFYPCNPDLSSFEVAFESTTPNYPGAKALKELVPMTKDMADYCLRALTETGEPQVDPPAGVEMTNDIAIHYKVKSIMFMAIQPQIGDAWMFGLHQCNHHRDWTSEDKKLFQMIGYRITNCIENMLYVDQLRKSEKKYRSLLESLQEGIWAIDKDAKTSFVNQPMAKMLGYTEVEMFGKHLFDFMDEEGIEDAKVKLDQRNKGVIEQHDFKFVKKDGQPIYTTVETAPLYDNGGNYDGAIAGVINITRRKQAEKELLQSEGNYRNLVNNIPDYVMRYDREYRHVFANEKAIRDTGKTAEEYINKTHREIGFSDHLCTLWENAIDRVFETGEMKTEIFEWDSAAGKKILEWRVLPEFSGDDSIETVLGISRDITQAIETEKALQVSEDKYRQITENIPGMVFQYVLHPNGSFSVPFISNRVYEYSGFTPEEIKSNPDLIFKPIHPDDLDYLKNEIINSSKQLSDFSLEHRIIKPSGEIKWFHVRSAPKKQENGDIIWDGISVDITGRYKAEEALRTSEAKMRSAFRVAPIGIGLVSNRVLLEVNEQLCKMTQYSSEELVGKNARILYPSDEDYEFVGREKYRQIKTHGTGTVETRFKRKDGKVIDVLMSSTPLNLEDLSAGVTFTALDITKRKQAKEALQESEKFLQTIIENIPDMIFVKDAKQLRFVRFNRAGEELLGYSREELIGKNDYDFFPKNEADFFTENDRVVLGSREHTDIPEEWIETKDKGKRILHTKKLPILDEKGEPRYLLGISEDITERKRLESQLQQAQKMESVGTLAGGVAHDFNNILSSIFGFTELALDDVVEGSALEDNLQEVYKAGKRARDLIKQILTFARQSDEKQKPTRVDIIVKEVMKLIRSTIPTSIEIKQSIESTSLVMGNPSQIHQLFMNLCTNAYQAMEDTGGILEITLMDVDPNEQSSLKLSDLKPGKYLKVTVSDTGTGIAPDIVGSIFEPYFTTKDPGEGTGMGLALVHGVIESCRGKITVDSMLGEGTTFTIYLPVTRKQSEHGAYLQEELPTGTERILFVDDEAPITKMGGQILERLGYTVTTRTRSIEALELFQAKPDDYDLVITDMTMPDLNGDKLAEELMKIRANIPVILCTGYSKKISDEMASEIGIKSFAYKPIVKADLAKTVRKVLDEAKIKNLE